MLRVATRQPQTSAQHGAPTDSFNPHFHNRISQKADYRRWLICYQINSNIPSIYGLKWHAWTYKLGNRSALKWVLDQYKEKKPKDPTIRAQFDTYRFADYKEEEGGPKFKPGYRADLEVMAVPGGVKKVRGQEVTQQLKPEVVACWSCQHPPKMPLLLLASPKTPTPTSQAHATY